MRLFAALLMFCCLGCGRGESLPFTDHSQDPEAYARDIKRLVLQQVEDSRNSHEPADHLVPLLTELEQYVDRPVGSYESIYSELLSLAREVHGACQRLESRPKGEVLDQLEQLVALAEKLPGEISVVSEKN